MTPARTRLRQRRRPFSGARRRTGAVAPAGVAALTCLAALTGPVAARAATAGGPSAAPGSGSVPIWPLLPVLAVAVVTGLYLGRRAKRRARAEGETRWRSVLDQAPLGMLVVQDGRVVLLNDAARGILGLPATDTATSAPTDALAASTDLAPLLPVLAAPATPADGSPGAATPRRVRLRLGDGRTRELRVLSLDTMFAGSAARLLCLLDGNAAPPSHGDRELERERLGQALEATRDGVWDADLETGRLVHNAAFGAVLDPGAPAPDDLRAWRELVHPADRPRLEQAVAANERGAVAGYECELRLRRRDGSVAWVREHGRVVERDASGRARRLAGTVREVTARKRAEQRLEVRNRLAAVFPGARGEELRVALAGVLRDVLESPLAQVGLFDVAGGLHLTRLGSGDEGPAADHAVLAPGDLPAGLRSVLTGAEPVATAEFAWVLAAGGPLTADSDAAAAADSRIWLAARLPGDEPPLGLIAVAGRAERYRAEDERLLAGLAADLAPLIRAHLETEAKEGQLAQAQKMEALGVLAGGIAHDFNNILQAILGFSALARQDAEHPERLLADLDRVQRATERGRDLVQRILQFSRGSEPEAPPLDPLPLVRQLVLEAQVGAPPRVTVRADLVADCGRVRAGPAQLRQVLVNLITNARQALEPDGGTLTITVAPAVVADGDHRLPVAWHGREVVMFTVTDTGPGIPESHRDRLFDPFFTTREVGQGAGLGLSVVHGLVGGLGGFVTIECPAAGGTTATVLLPQADASATGGNGHAADAPPAAATRRRVLFVDDDVEIRELALAMLGLAGFAVELAADGLAARELLAAGSKYDVVVTDEVMPGLSGRQLAAQLAQSQPGLPIVLVSGLDTPAAPPEPLPGIREVVAKPFRGETLVQAVRRALEGPPGAAG